MTDRGREFIGNEFTRLLKDWYRLTEGLSPAEVQVYGEDVRLVIGKVLEELALIQSMYTLIASHLPLLGNDNSSKPVPGFDPGHIMGTGEQESHSKAQNMEALVYTQVFDVGNKKAELYLTADPYEFDLFESHLASSSAPVFLPTPAHASNQPANQNGNPGLKQLPTNTQPAPSANQALAPGAQHTKH
ncbi:hypothetical protein DSO57_1021879 [Entomophthora muscae]|uniref:Uncharacterized protein n=1 Tax=Entomophthora muscae TaxID=34485 RepID=A0ACC2TQX6_9FUNG|nr:hypothetical protein DSO57_1021879 [Entomophthora muscae]